MQSLGGISQSIFNFIVCLSTIELCHFHHGHPLFEMMQFLDCQVVTSAMKILFIRFIHRPRCIDFLFHLVKVGFPNCLSFSILISGALINIVLIMVINFSLLYWIIFQKPYRFLYCLRRVMLHPYCKRSLFWTFWSKNNLMLK